MDELHIHETRMHARADALKKLLTQSLGDRDIPFNSQIAMDQQKSRSKLPPAQREKVRDIYGLNDIPSDLAKEHKKELELCIKSIEGAFSAAFDTGLARGITFYPDEYTHLTEKGVHVFKRSTFVTEIEKRGTVAPHFSFIDIASVRSADVEPIKGYKAADYLLNRAARSIEQAIDEYCTQHHIQEQNKKPLLGRYGGDEFIIGWMEKPSPEQQREFELILKHILEPEEKTQNIVYYEKKLGKKGVDKVEYIPGHIALKDNKVQWIGTPENEIDRAIFHDYFRRGLILDNEQLDKVKHKFQYQDKGEFSFELYTRLKKEEVRVPSPLDSLTTVEEKIKYLSAQHDEFVIPLAIAHYWDELESQELGTATTRHQEKMITHVQDVLFDSLLGHAVFSKFDFEEHYNKGHIDSTIVIDLKFIKEMNELVGYVDADESITGLWGKIYASMAPEDRNKVIFARSGGTFMIGIKKGEILGQDSLTKLQNLTTFDLDVDPSEAKEMVTVPLGNSLATRKEGEVMPSTGFYDAMENAEIDFFRKIVTVVKDKPEYKTILMSLQDPIVEGEQIGMGELLWRFLRLKRYDERMGKLITEVSPSDPLRSEMINLYGLLLGQDQENIMYAALHPM